MDELRPESRVLTKFVGPEGAAGELGENPVFRALRQVRIVGRRDCFRVADIHVVICQVKARVSRARSGERANQQF